MTTRQVVALIPCTSGKHATGVTPRTLYKGGPFSMMMKHSQQRCDRVVILSAKYGLLELNDTVSYYDAYIPTLSPAERAALVDRIRGQAAGRFNYLYAAKVISYLPAAYWALLSETLEALAPTIARPYAGLGMLKLLQVLSNEIKHYGTYPARR